MKAERRKGESPFILPPSSISLGSQPLRAALALLDELPEPAAPLLDERLLVELEADVGLLPRHVRPLHVGVVLVQHVPHVVRAELDSQLELRRLELLAAGVVRVD